MPGAEVLALATGGEVVLERCTSFTALEAEPHFHNRFCLETLGADGQRAEFTFSCVLAAQ